MTTGEQPANPYEPPEHGGMAAVNGPLRPPINRKKVIRAVVIWFGFIGISGTINLLSILLPTQSNRSLGPRSFC